MARSSSEVATSTVGSSKQSEASVAVSQNEQRDVKQAAVQVSQLEYRGRAPMPDYPRQARSLGQEGLVVVRVTIDQTGRVESAVVRRSSGFASLDEAALNAARGTAFKPYQRNGIPLRAFADIPFNFVLRK